MDSFMFQFDLSGSFYRDRWAALNFCMDMWQVGLKLYFWEAYKCNLDHILSQHLS
jgi:hypothetical protein